jgi:hypothetical protein
MTITTPSKTYSADTPCKHCGGVKKYLADNRCVQCRREYMKRRSQSPEGKACFKKYWQSKKGKAKRKEYYQSEKRKQYMVEWKQSDHGKKILRYAHVKRTYNLSKEQYEILLKKQNFVCAICKDSLERPYVDHNHQCCNGESSCGKCVRGIICFDCKRLLSDAHDDIITLQSAIDYLQSR